MANDTTCNVVPNIYQPPPIVFRYCVGIVDKGEESQGIVGNVILEQQSGQGGTGLGD